MRALSLYHSRSPVGFCNPQVIRFWLKVFPHVLSMVRTWFWFRLAQVLLEWSLHKSAFARMFSASCSMLISGRFNKVGNRNSCINGWWAYLLKCAVDFFGLEFCWTQHFNAFSGNWTHFLLKRIKSLLWGKAKVMSIWSSLCPHYPDEAEFYTQPEKWTYDKVLAYLLSLPGRQSILRCMPESVLKSKALYHELCCVRLDSAAISPWQAASS